MELAMEKRGDFLYCLFFPKGVFLTFVFYLNVYWIHFQNIHTLTYQKTLLHTLLLLVFKIVESLQYIFNKLPMSTTWQKVHYLPVINQFNRDMLLFEMLVFIIRIIWILSNIWLMFICLKRFIAAHKDGRNCWVRT